MIEEIKLPRVGVRFEQEPHKYYRESDGKELQGVTGVIGSMLFPDKYAGISDAIMAHAAAYGSEVHEAIELFYTCDIDDGSQEVANYRYMLEMAGLHHVASEYLVSDGENFASAIDHVCQDDNGNIFIIDTKTTSGGPDRDYLSWQLSIYATWFERQTGLKVAGLRCAWVRHEDCEFVPIFRLEDKQVDKLFADYLAGVPSTQSAAQAPAECLALADAIEEIMRRQKEYDAQVADMKKRMLELMKANDCTRVDLDGRVLVTLVSATTRETLDSKALKEHFPNIYTKFVKTSAVKESLKITIR